MNDKVRWPIDEAICLIEFNPSEDFNWDLTAFGRYYSLIEEDYPKKEEFIISCVNDPELENRAMRFFSKDEKRLVQLVEDSLIVNQLAPYPRWESDENSFRITILNRLRDYVNNFKPRSVSAIVLRYVNKFEFPATDFNIEKVFSRNEYFPEIAFKKDGQFMIHTGFINGDDYKSEIHAGFIETDREDSIGVVLDIELSYHCELKADPDEISTKLDEQHHRINKIFKECISYSLKKKYGLI